MEVVGALEESDESGSANLGEGSDRPGKHQRRPAMRFSGGASSELGEEIVLVVFLDKAMVREHWGGMGIISPLSIRSSEGCTEGLHSEHKGGGHGDGGPVSTGPNRSN